MGAFTQDLTVEPRLAVAVNVMDGLAIRGSIGRYGRIAAGEDRSAQFGNPSLPRARATQALMTVAIQPMEELQLEITGFASLQSSLAMRSTAEPAQLAGALAPTGEGRVFGGQAMLRAQLPHGVFGWVSYTLSRAQRRAAPVQGAIARADRQARDRAPRCTRDEHGRKRLRRISFGTHPPRGVTGQPCSASLGGGEGKKHKAPTGCRGETRGSTTVRSAVRWLGFSLQKRCRLVPWGGDPSGRGGCPSSSADRRLLPC